MFERVVLKTVFLANKSQVDKAYSRPSGWRFCPHGAPYLGPLKPLEHHSNNLPMGLREPSIWTLLSPRDVRRKNSVQKLSGLPYMYTYIFLTLYRAYAGLPFPLRYFNGGTLWWIRSYATMYLYEVTPLCSYVQLRHYQKAVDYVLQGYICMELLSIFIP